MIRNTYLSYFSRLLLVVASFTTPVVAWGETQTVTVSNVGAKVLTISNISIGGKNQNNFSQTNNCGNSLDIGKSCTVDVKFIPSSPGLKQATLTVRNSANLLTVTLNGTSIAPEVTITPEHLAFGKVAINTAKTLPLTLANTGTAPLVINSIKIPAGAFTQTNNCGTSLAARASCTIKVTFTPTSKTAQSATLTVKDSAGKETQTINLTGKAG